MIGKYEWKVSFTMRLRSDLGYTAAYIRREVKRRFNASKKIKVVRGRYR